MQVYLKFIYFSHIMFPDVRRVLVGPYGVQMQYLLKGAFFVVCFLVSECATFKCNLNVFHLHVCVCF